MSVGVADFFRYLTLVLGVAIFAMTFDVIVHYYRAYRVAPPGRRGLVPAHVALIGVSYLLAIGEAAWQNVSRLGWPLTGYVPLNMAIFGTGLWAMWLILQYERRVVTFKRKVRLEEEIEIRTQDSTQTEWDHVTERRQSNG